MKVLAGEYEEQRGLTMEAESIRWQEPSLSLQAFSGPRKHVLSSSGEQGADDDTLLPFCHSLLPCSLGHVFL